LVERVLFRPRPAGAGPASNTSDGDPANAGIRREPELPEHEEIIPPPPPPSQEFDFLDDEPDVDAAKARAMRQRMRMVARQASMDPADGIELEKEGMHDQSHPHECLLRPRIC
jgi:type IV secretion system protein VirD4